MKKDSTKEAKEEILAVYEIDFSAFDGEVFCKARMKQDHGGRIDIYDQSGMIPKLDVLKFLIKKHNKLVKENRELWAKVPYEQPHIDMDPALDDWYRIKK